MDEAELQSRQSEEMPTLNSPDPGARRRRGRHALRLRWQPSSQPRRRGRARRPAGPRIRTLRSPKRPDRRHPRVYRGPWLDSKSKPVRSASSRVPRPTGLPFRCCSRLVSPGASSLDLAPAWQRDAEGGGARSGITDFLVGIKWRLVDAAPVVGAVAMQSTLALPTGSPESGRGSGKAAVNVLVISSRRIRPLSLDVNAGYTRLGGESATTPRDSTVWTAAASMPVAGRSVGLPSSTATRVRADRTDNRPSWLCSRGRA